MRSLNLAVIIILVLALNGVAQQKPGSGARSSAETHHAQANASSRAEDMQSLREDLTRMKALVQQMQSNLGFVDTSQSALKHQFQLEIEMWQTLISQMERRLAEPPAR